MSGKLTLWEYGDLLIHEVKRFRHDWSLRASKDPERWPTILEPGDWDEQFQAWSESQRRNQALKDEFKGSKNGGS